MNISQKLNSTIYAVILSNLILLLAVFILNWDPLTVFILYILETLIIGFFHVIKLSTLAVINKYKSINVEDIPSLNGLIFNIMFFIFHFGFFLFVQTLLILPMEGSSFTKTLFSIKNYMQGENLYFLALIVIINLYLYIKYIFIDTAFEGQKFNSIMMEPYPRIFVQQFVVIFGGGILMFLGLKGIGGIIFITFFVIIKTLFELLVASGSYNTPSNLWYNERKEI